MEEVFGQKVLGCQIEAPSYLRGGEHSGTSVALRYLGGAGPGLWREGVAYLRADRRGLALGGKG